MANSVLNNLTTANSDQSSEQGGRFSPDQITDLLAETSFAPVNEPLSPSLLRLRALREKNNARSTENATPTGAETSPASSEILPQLEANFVAPAYTDTIHDQTISPIPQQHTETTFASLEPLPPLTSKPLTAQQESPNQEGRFFQAETQTPQALQAFANTPLQPLEITAPVNKDTIENTTSKQPEPPDILREEDLPTPVSNPEPNPTPVENVFEIDKTPSKLAPQTEATYSQIVQLFPRKSLPIQAKEINQIFRSRAA